MWWRRSSWGSSVVCRCRRRRPREIYEGTLTRYLLFPTQYLPFKYAQHLGQMVPGLLQLSGYALLFFWVFELPRR